MAHEITDTDNVVLHKSGAWHGLGMVVEDAPTPREALTLAGLEWGIEQRPLIVKGPDGNDIEVPDHLSNWRLDTNTFMGVTSDRYVPIQNYELADFCEALQLNDELVKVETAGSIQGGKKVWFLLKGKSFDVANGDQIFPYTLISNGHDGFSTFRGTPTTVRAVCSNTLHAIIPRDDTGELLGSAFTFKHTVNVKDRLEDAKKMLKQYSKAIEATRGVMNRMAQRQINNEQLQKFFVEMYVEEFGEFKTNPGTKVEENRKNRAMEANSSFMRRFDDEKEIAGTSFWNAFNAWSGLIQHDRKSRGKDDTNRVEKRAYSNLFGLNEKRTQRALKAAYKSAFTAS